MTVATAIPLGALAGAALTLTIIAILAHWARTPHVPAAGATTPPRPPGPPEEPAGPDLPGLRPADYLTYVWARGCTPGDHCWTRYHVRPRRVDARHQCTRHEFDAIIRTIEKDFTE